MKIRTLLKPALFSACAIAAIGMSAQTTLTAPAKPVDVREQPATIQKQRVEATQLRSDRFADKIAKLDLTPAQQSQFEDLETERAEKIQKIKANRAEDAELNRNKVRETNILYRNKLKAILTPEQLAKLKTEREQARKQRVQDN